jgi:hypothetical protein
LTRDEPERQGDELSKFSKVFDIDVDGATLFLFHPEDLSHTTDWPIDWYMQSAAWKAHSKAGTLIAWGTGEDGVFRVRITDGGATRDEKAHIGDRWKFLCTVRRGRLLLDNGDALAADSGPHSPATDASPWIDIANGIYHIEVSALDTEENDALPDYLVQVRPARGPTPALARKPPQLLPVGAIETRQSTGSRPKPLSHSFDGKTALDFSKPMPCGISAHVGQTGQHFTSSEESDLLQAFTPEQQSQPILYEPFIICAEAKPGAFGQLCRTYSHWAGTGEPARFNLSAHGLVRIEAVHGRLVEGVIHPESKLGRCGKSRPQSDDFPFPLLAVTVSPITPDETADLADLPALRDATVASLTSGPLGKAMGANAAFQADVVRTWDDFSTLARFLLFSLPIDANTRLTLAAMDLRDRLPKLLALLRS